MLLAVPRARRPRDSRQGADATKKRAGAGHGKLILLPILAANPKQVEQYRAGKKTMIGFFVRQVMKASKGQANPQLVNEVLTKKLEGLE